MRAVCTVRNWSGRQDLNLRPPHPQCGALPDCATPRVERGDDQSPRARDYTQYGLTDQLFQRDRIIARDKTSLGGREHLQDIFQFFDGFLDHRLQLGRRAR